MSTKPPVNHYKLYSVKDLLELKDDPERWIVENFVPKVGRVLLYGKGGEMKSSLMFDLAIAVASGGHMLEQLKVVRQYGPVVLLSTEGSIYSNKDRLLGLMRSRNIPPELIQLHYGQQAIELHRPEAAATLRRLIEVTKPSMLVMDPLVSFFGGNENSTEDMARFVNRLNEVIADFEMAVVLVHHASKIGDLRGSSVLQGWADSVVKAEAARAVNIPGIPEPKDIVTLTCEKQRDGRTGVLFSAVPFFDKELRMTTFSAFEGTDAKQIVTAYLRLEILKYLRRSGACVTKSQLASAFRIGNERVTDAVERLEQEGHIEPVKLLRSTGEGRTPRSATGWRATGIGTRVDAARAILRAQQVSSEDREVLEVQQGRSVPDDDGF